MVEKEIAKNSSGIKVENEVEVNIFPNPTSGILNIKSKYKINSIVVFNTSGTLMQKIEKVEEQINLSKLTKGIYYLQISTESGKTIKKVILE